MKAIQVVNLQKSYGEREVLHNISFDVEVGEIFGLLGVNGAGKTTTLECLEGIKHYHAGDIQLSGSKGVQLQSSSLPSAMKVKEAVNVFAKYKGVDVDWEMFSALGLKEVANRTYEGLSTGQKRRLHLMIALLGNPDILFLDEPTAGLDVEARNILHGLIKDLKKMGKTIILASHDMSEVEELCDRLAILKDGNIAFLGTNEELASLQEFSTIEIYCAQDLSNLPLQSAKFIKEERQVYEFTSKDVVSALSEILKLVEKEGVIIQDIQVHRATLEESFLKIAKEELS